MIKLKEYPYLSALILMTLIGLSLSSCNGNRVFYGETIINDLWTYTDTLIYEFEIQDTSKSYLLGMEVDWNIEKYPYQNCYLNFNTQYPNGESQKELLNIDLTNDMGMVHGDCNKSNCVVDIILQPTIRFDQIGSYKIKINQNTRETNLPGLSKMALYLEVKE